MLVQKDWLLRQISTMIETMSLFLSKKKPEMEEIYKKKTEDLWTLLDDCIERGDYSQGEDLLFEAIHQGREGAYEVALDFYKSLSLLEEDKLQDGNFSREEILQGLKDLAKAYGIEETILKLLD